MSDTDRLHRAGEYLRKQEQHQHADAVDQACHDLDNLRTRIQEVLLLDIAAQPVPARLMLGQRVPA